MNNLFYEVYSNEIREEIQKYIYKNPLTSFMSNWGHWTIKDLKEKYRKKSKKEKIDILDLCCGLGHNCDFLNDFEIYTGIDHNINFINEARQNYNKHSFIHKSVLDADWNLEKKYNVVTAIQALEHFSNEHLQIIFRNVLKYLQEDGIFLYIIPLDSSFLINLGRQLTTERYMNTKFKNLDYMKWLGKEEHINEYKSITSELKNFFNLSKEVFLPFNIRVINLNIYNIGICKPR
ncbi:MAG: class I SAM-dependent methyltransferase [Candidatus Melainabacteria bacterium]|nr:class I SAM-dependent methyltransferase [Candidatus Melainabacteria bacterium]